MKLPDFEEFEPFNEMRQQMGAHDLGSFEAFDPHYQLTTPELEKLKASFLSVPFERVRGLADGTLAYKDARVFMLHPSGGQLKQEGLGDPVFEYHFADCDTLSFQSKNKPTNHELILLATDINTALVEHIKVLLQHDVIELRPCWHCLHKLKVDGFDGIKQRKRLYSDAVWRSYNPENFKSQYLIYPLPESDW